MPSLINSPNSYAISRLCRCHVLIMWPGAEFALVNLDCDDKGLFHSGLARSIFVTSFADSVADWVYFQHQKCASWEKSSTNLVLNFFLNGVLKILTYVYYMYQWTHGLPRRHCSTATPCCHFITRDKLHDIGKKLWCNWLSDDTKITNHLYVYPSVGSTMEPLTTYATNFVSRNHLFIKKNTTKYRLLFINLFHYKYILDKWIIKFIDHTFDYTRY
jgi:hypothetical protein